MRQVGTLRNESEAQRFAAYLVTQGVAAHAEPDRDDWIIWVRDENDIAQARESFADFRHNPDDPRYTGAERAAETIRREAARKQEAARKNMIEMSSRWSRRTSGKTPFVVAVVVLCSIVSLASDFSNARRGIGHTIHQQLMFVSDLDYRVSRNNPLASIAKGEVWRIVTPIFLHGNLMHLAFNMMAFFFFAAQLERLRGAFRLAMLMLAIAVVSNLGQALTPAVLSGTPFFVGLSGVVFGLFGYSWMQSRYVRGSQIFLPSSTIFMMLIMLGIFILPVFSNIANLAHVFGLVTGMAIGYAPALRKS